MLAIIPARGGSKGLPGKNIRDFAGKPLIAHSILAARATPAVSRVIVSTDSSDIADVAISFGAECPFLRPEHLASDEAAAIDAYLYTAGELERREGTPITSFVVLLPTAPLRLSEDIEAAIALFHAKKASSVVSFTASHPASWIRYLGADGEIRSEDLGLNSNRQAYPDAFVPNGAIYVFSRRILERRLYYDEGSYAYLMPKMRSVDIDDKDDFEMAEKLFLASQPVRQAEEGLCEF